MQGSTPQTYTIADCLKWYDDDELILNPTFQRGSVWSTQARSYLIDSILRGYPIPKLLIRTSVDRDSRRTIRDVVDGQQRLRTIIDFSEGKLILGAKAGEFQGLRYGDLDNELKDSFLAYKLTCEQLINADDDDVLEVFVRINSYAVPVVESELRNARFNNDFSDLVKQTIRAVPELWHLGVISERDRVRFVDQSLIAELYAFLDRGVIDGSEADITRYYNSVRTATLDELPNPALLIGPIRQAVDLLAGLEKEPIVQRPHFLMLVAAIMYANGHLPPGKLDMDDVPDPAELLLDAEEAQQSLRVLNEALSTDQEGSRFVAFREARASTQRMRSRNTRFRYIARALAGEFAAL